MIRWIPPRLHAPARALCLAALLAGPVAGGEEPPPEAAHGVPADVAAAVTHAAQAWLVAFERGDAEALAGLFTEDGIYAANTGEVLSGHAAIRDAVGAWGERRAMFLEALGLPADSPIDVEEELLRSRAAGALVYRLSRFMILVEPSRCVMDAGHALSVWRREAGEWRIDSLLGNRDRRPPEAACGTRGAPNPAD